MRRRLINFKKGFTLPEMMVSLAIFSVISLLAISAVITSADLARRTAAQRTLMDNLDFAIENISRRVRVGTKYICKTDTTFPVPAIGATSVDCASGPDGPGNILAFQSVNSPDPVKDEEMMYYFDANAKGIFLKRRTANGESAALRLTAPEITITDTDFYVSGALLENQQPKVLVLIHGYVPAKNGAQIPFDIQTTISQRRLEN